MGSQSSECAALQCRPHCGPAVRAQLHPPALARDRRPLLATGSSSPLSRVRFSPPVPYSAGSFPAARPSPVHLPPGPSPRPSPDSSAFLSSRRRVVSSTPAPFLSPSLFPALVPVGQLCEPAPRPWEAPLEGPGLFHLERRVGSGRCFPQRPGPQKCRSYGKWEVEVLEDSWIVFTWMGNWCGLYRGCLFGSEAA